MPDLITSKTATVVNQTVSTLLLMVVFSICTCEGSDLIKSVGQGGANLEPDVLLVQQRLNEVPKASGGPAMKLVQDGKSGPQTIAAIKRFQKIQLGIESGRIEVGEQTDMRLAEFHLFADQPRPGVPIAWGKQVTGEFKFAVINTARTIDVDPNYLMAAMAFESKGSFSPAITNAAGSGATGLIQFMPSTAKGLGTTCEELAQMSAVKQLEYVAKHFKPFKGKCHSLSDVYMAILFPKAVGQPEGYILFDIETAPEIYKRNKSLDENADGKVTKLEASSRVERKLQEGLKPENRS